MSWSVQAIGKPEAVAAAIEKQFLDQSPCSEPEEAVRQSTRATLAATLAAQTPESIVEVSASGSMSRNPWPDGPVSNTLSIKVEPKYGYVG